MSDQSGEQATTQSDVAAPGPHPHESADVAQWRGDSTEVPTSAEDNETSTTQGEAES